MKQLVAQNLGDKSQYDSVLKDIGTVGHDAIPEEPPLEKCIKDALNYDTNHYREALGLDKSNK